MRNVKCKSEQSEKVSKVCYSVLECARVSKVLE